VILASFQTIVVTKAERKLDSSKSREAKADLLLRRSATNLDNCIGESGKKKHLMDSFCPEVQSEQANLKRSAGLFWNKG
jgi:hypothetical protein